MIVKNNSACQEYCGRTTPCGNRYCSANPKHYEVEKKDPGDKKK